MSLSVVYASDTGHVLGALAVAGPIGAAPAVGDLVGERLPVPVTLSDRRPVDLPLAASRLTAVAVQAEPDIESAVLAHPTRYRVDTAGGGAAGPRLSRLDAWTAGEDAVVRTAAGVKVTLPEQATETTPVLMVMGARGGTAVTRLEEIASGNTEVTVRVSLDGGQHGVLTLVAGWEGRLDVVASS